MRPGRALLVGGRGFLGRHVIEALTGAGWDVVCASRRPGAGPDDPRTVVLDGRLPMLASLTRALIGLRPSLVVNAAGLVWQNAPAAMAAANTELPERLARALADSGCRSRLVHLGSCLEYGRVSPPTAINERTPTRPETFYGRSKLGGTNRIRAIADAHRLDVVVLRVFNAVGAGMSPASVLGHTVETLLHARNDRERAEIELVDLRQYRDFVDARDVAGAVRAAAEYHVPHTQVQIFNIGSGVARPVEDVVRGLADVSGIDYRLTKLPAPAGTGRSAGAHWQLADTGLARRHLGWSATTPLVETLSNIWVSAQAGEGQLATHLPGPTT